MLRAGPLSSPEVLERLEAGFVCAWVLRQDLDPWVAQTEDADVARVAKVVAGAYVYPVDSHVLSARGELLGRLAANDLEADAVEAYLGLLAKAEGGEHHGGK